MPKSLIISTLAAVAALAPAAPAGADVTIGSGLASAANSNNCGGSACTTANLDLNADLAPGGLRSPVTGTVTSWRFKSGSNGNTVSLRVLRPGGGVSFTGAGTSSSVTSASGVNGPFQTSLPIRAGDAIGLNTSLGAIVMNNALPGTQLFWTLPQLADGSARDGTSSMNQAVLVQANVEPSNALGFGKLTKNRKKGTAQLTVDVPNPGQLSVAGVGVRVAGGASRTLAAASSLKITIKATGAKARKLRDTGKVKLAPLFSFTPVNGATAAETQTVKLVKKA